MPYGDLTQADGPFFLVLRPEDRHDETVAALGPVARAVCGSVVSYEPLVPCFPDISSAQGVIVTSRRAIPAPADFPEDLKAKPFYVVGAETARHLEKIYGIAPAIIAPTGMALMDAMVAQVPLHDGPFLYLRGDEVAVDVHTVLGLVGAQVTEVRMYESRPVQILPKDIQNVMQNTDLKGILFFSRQNARVFYSLIMLPENAFLWGCFSRLVALCISGPVLECIQDLPWKDKVIAPVPDLKGMVTALSTMK